MFGSTYRLPPLSDAPSARSSPNQRRCYLSLPLPRINVAVSGRLNRRRQAIAQRLVDDRKRTVNFTGADSERRRDAPDRSARGDLANVHGQAQFHAATRHLEPQIVKRLARLAVLHELNADEQPLPAHVADDVVALLKLSESTLQAFAHCACVRRQLLTFQH